MGFFVVLMLWCAYHLLGLNLLWKSLWKLFYYNYFVYRICFCQIPWTIYDLGKWWVQKIFGWNFDNSYLQLPEIMATKYSPVPVKEPKVLSLIILSKNIRIRFSSLTEEEKAKLFSGNSSLTIPKLLLKVMQAISLVHFTMLGDGRAIVLGEHISPEQKDLISV